MQFKVTLADAGSTLLAFLRKNCLHAPSVKAIKRAIDSKRCRVSGRVEMISTRRLREGDVVEFEMAVEKKERKISILYEDDDFLIIDKPAGVSCEPKNFKEKLVHRLDKETSGVLILAKHEKARLAMVDLFTKKEIEKTYLALVDGVVKKQEGKITLRLQQRGDKVFAGAGQEAETLWRCLGVGKTASLLLCKPTTGRTHQIRVHLKEIGHPIVGDLRYGKTFRCRLRPERHMLHAVRICFEHPFTHKKIEAEAPVPDDFLDLLESIGMAHLVELAHE